MRIISILSCLLLSACVSAPKHTVISDADKSTRVEYLAAHSSWAFNGRLAYSHLGEGGSAKIQWQQNTIDTEVKLSSALNLGLVIFTVKEGVAQIKSSDGGLKQGDPEQLMQELLKTPLPYSTIALGLRADWVGMPDATFTWLDGLPLQVVTQGWTWRYQEWSTVPAVLPRKIELSQGQTRLRIVIDQWLEIDNDK